MTSRTPGSQRLLSRRCSARAARIAAAAVVLAAACGDGDTTGPAPPPPPPPPRPASVTVSPASIELRALTDTAQLTAEVRDQNGAVMSGIAVTWTSSQAEVASVSSSGTVTAVGNGTATITATAATVSGTATVTVEQAPAEVTLSPVTVTFNAIGDTARITATVLDANGHAIDSAAVTWSSSDAAVATVDEGGLVTAVASGTARIEGTAGSVSDEAAITVAQEPATVQVKPEALLFTTVGDTARLSATVFDANGHPIDSAAVTWSSSDAAVATVDEGGLVTAAGAGTAEVHASVGSVRGSAEILVASVSSDRDVLEFLYRATGGAAWARNDNWLSGRPLSDWYGVEVDGQGRVTALRLPGNNLRGPLLPIIGALDRLRVLNLELNALTGSLPEDWRALTRLRFLSVQRNGIGGSIPSWLSDLGSLEVLLLGENHFEGVLPAEISNLGRLRDLSLGWNPLTGTIPENWGSLSSLRYLSLGKY